MHFLTLTWLMQPLNPACFCTSTVFQSHPSVKTFCAEGKDIFTNVIRVIIHSSYMLVVCCRVPGRRESGVKGPVDKEAGELVSGDGVSEFYISVSPHAQSAC